MICKLDRLKISAQISAQGLRTALFLHYTLAVAAIVSPAPAWPPPAAEPPGVHDPSSPPPEVRGDSLASPSRCPLAAEAAQQAQRLRARQARRQGKRGAAFGPSPARHTARGRGRLHARPGALRACCALPGQVAWPWGQGRNGPRMV